STYFLPNRATGISLTLPVSCIPGISTLASIINRDLILRFPLVMPYHLQHLLTPRNCFTENLKRASCYYLYWTKKDIARKFSWQSLLLFFYLRKALSGGPK